MSSHRLIALFLLVVGCPIHWALGEVEISSIFSDHMVLQQGLPVPIWGKASPGDKVEVRFSGKTATSSADEDGCWKVTLPPMPPDAHGRELTIAIASSAGNFERVIRDVLVGEVWFCAGQSNIAQRLSSTRDPEQHAADANDPLLRTFNVTQRPAERPAEFTAEDDRWRPCDPTVALDFSAVGFHFARKLRAELNVPVGIILCAWGGSSVATWMSPEAMRAPELHTLVPEDLIGWRYNVQPYRLYNGMLHPLAPYAFAGVVWYQGETEGTEYQGAYRNAWLYRHLFPAMIEDWRRLWGRKEMPFYWVQLPNLRTPTLNWPTLRESQAHAQRIPHTGMIPTIDIGDDNDLHPKDKTAFGHRLADLVLARQYSKPTWAGAPEFDSIKVEGSSISVRFGNAGNKLKTSDGNAPRTFTIAAADGKYHPAEAQIDGDSVIVRSDAVPNPVSVRYAWAQAPGVNLCNAAGLPVIPFRTDKFPVVGEEMTWQELPTKKDLAVMTTGGELGAATHSTHWLAASDTAAAALLKNNRMFITSPRTCELRFLYRPTRGMTASPTLFWTTTPSGAARELDASKGMTVEALIQSSVVAHPLRGFDLEVGLRHSDTKLTRYLLSISPMFIRAFKEAEVHVLRGDFDNTKERLAYRLAIRPDGIAQIYVNGQRIGLLAGETLERATDAQSYIRIGKQSAEGEYIATIVHAAFDTMGPYAP